MFKIYKTNIVNFRFRSNQVTDRSFNIGTKVVKVTSEYVYLGLLLTEHLDYTMMAKYVSKSASRSLGLVISKFKAFGGLQCNTFTKLYDAVVCSMIRYGTAIWVDRSFSCIKVIQNRAERYFMGVRPYTLNSVTIGDII